MSQIAVIGQVEIHPEDAPAAAELMSVMTSHSSNEQGCLHYAYSRDLLMANRFQLSELWEDDQALAAHFKAEHTAVYRAGMAKLRVQRRTVKRYEVTNVKDL